MEVTAGEVTMDDTVMEAMREEWLQGKRQEATSLMAEIDRAIVAPLPDPHAQKRARLATCEGQLKALKPVLTDMARDIDAKIAESEAAREAL